jgi:hypothetical protein
MEKRGYKLTSNPDLLVNFSGKLQEKQDIESTPGPYYGYRGGLYRAWPGYAMGNDVHTVDYTEGTLNIDLVDAARKQMVWEGVGIGKVPQEKMKNPSASINQAVDAIFSQYPFQAGVAQPLKTAQK